MTNSFRTDVPMLDFVADLMEALAKAKHHAVQLDIETPKGTVVIEVMLVRMKNPTTAEASA